MPDQDRGHLCTPTLASSAALLQPSFQVLVTHRVEKEPALPVVGGAMCGGRIYSQVCVLACIGQRCQQLHGVRRMDVVIEHTVDQQQMPVKGCCMGHVGTVPVPFGIVRGQTHIPLG